MKSKSFRFVFSMLTWIGMIQIKNHEPDRTSEILGSIWPSQTLCRWIPVHSIIHNVIVTKPGSAKHAPCVCIAYRRRLVPLWICHAISAAKSTGQSIVPAYVYQPSRRKNNGVSMGTVFGIPKIAFLKVIWQPSFPRQTPRNQTIPHYPFKGSLHPTQRTSNHEVSSRWEEPQKDEVIVQDDLMLRTIGSSNC